MSEIDVEKSSKLEKSLVIATAGCKKAVVQNCQITVRKSLEFFLRRFR